MIWLDWKIFNQIDLTNKKSDLTNQKSQSFWNVIVIWLEKRDWMNNSDYSTGLMILIMETLMHTSVTLGITLGTEEEPSHRKIKKQHPEKKPLTAATSSYPMESVLSFSRKLVVVLRKQIQPITTPDPV